MPHSKSFLNPFPPRHLCSQQYVFPPLPLLRARGRVLQFGKIIIPMLCLLCIFTDGTLLRNLKPMPKDCYAETLGIPKRLLRTQKLKTRTPVTTRITPVGGGDPEALGAPTPWTESYILDMESCNILPQKLRTLVFSGSF